MAGAESNISVVPGGDEGTEEKQPKASSPMRNIKGRIDEARRKRYIERAVPGVEEFVVRYGTTDVDTIENIDQKRKNLKGGHKVLARSMDVLIKTCLGIFEDVDGELKSIDPEDREGEPLTFSSERMAEILEVESGRAADVLTAFYPVEGDIIGLAGDVMKNSGILGQEALEEVRGN